MQNRNCCVEQNKPSGHAGHFEPYRPCNYATPRKVNFCIGDIPLSDNCRYDFSGPYKDCHPPGDRTPAVGEPEWGDVPYLPSYGDETQTKLSAPPDNLYFSGPFFKGVSETHEEFVNRGGIEPRKFHKYERHYQEPGMKNNLSITYTDFGPPYPMTARDKHPSIKEPPKAEQYKPAPRQRLKNPHAKELEAKCAVPEVAFIDDEPVRDFNTEYNDNYICYQKLKQKTKLLDPKPSPREIFRDNLIKSHSRCPYDIPYHFLDAEIRCNPKVSNEKESDTRTPWLKTPKCQTTNNEYMILPSKCTCE